MEWRPATIDEVKNILATDLFRCDPQQIAVFREYSIDPYYAPIERHGTIETVVVIARRLRDVMYWEDVEEGFNISPVGSDGKILEHWCNQDDLGAALNRWIEGRRTDVNFGPARPVNS